MDDNNNKNQPSQTANDYQKILDEYAASIKPEATTDTIAPEEIKPEEVKTVKLDEVKDSSNEKAFLKDINNPQIESPVHPSLAANLEADDDYPKIPSNEPEKISPINSIKNDFVPPTPPTPVQEPVKTPEQIKSEIDKILATDTTPDHPLDDTSKSPKLNIFKILFIISLITFLGVASVLTYTLFLNPPTNDKKVDSDQQSTVTPTSTVSNGSCELNGSTYQIGESFASADGCNTCSCQSADVITCTEKACLSTPTPSTSSATKTTVTPTKTISNIPKDWKTYTDPTYKFSISYPSTWTVNTKSVDNQVVSISSPEKVRSPKTYPEYDYLKIYFYKDYQTSLTNSKTLESYLSNKTDFSSFNKTKIIDINAYLANENGMSNNSYPAYFIINGDNLFEINSDDQSFSESEKQIINTFKFN